ncbi:monovalent cation/H(+) antiporter subunit G [Streptomyces sp. NBC_00237]|uniref:monovalent cation/H(+) antiporter subunit G n=1 Tax=Streptomyces sp. NBC_00237 TaxID=2975687 RepID=UPI0022522DD4|nr:monovalent cation/H(+) antiporter subunit G [Streptomyces sp. NBC_00237]MCX5200219.1 monovalent cation/H(+) antiporter subunit G [Streptomyces sp. NBC_00237]
MSNWSRAADLISSILLLIGAVNCLSGVIGLLRLPDVFTRSYAATNPQTFGMLMLLAGVALRLRSAFDLGTLALVAFFQLLTSAVAAHLVARAAYRTGLTGETPLLYDELGEHPRQ